jgi:hypothetical protein
MNSIDYATSAIAASRPQVGSSVPFIACLMTRRRVKRHAYFRHHRQANFDSNKDSLRLRRNTF